jgi:hypothetical protein
MPFTCRNCKREVPLKAPGTKNRNHCPYCLNSLHVDNTIGDRRSTCLGLMPPIGKIYKKDGEEVLVHQCLDCGLERKNRVAGDDSYELIEKLPELDSTKYL